MAYTDFTIDELKEKFGLVVRSGLLFEGVAPIVVPQTLRERLNVKGVPLRSEKVRSEIIIMPVLLEMLERNQNRLTLFSGERLEGDSSVKLVGECDFLLVNVPNTPVLESPIFCVAEAKKQDMDLGVEQCAAQLLGVQLFNQRHGSNPKFIFGCVTTGETWQFLRLEGKNLVVDQRRYFLSELEYILGILQTIIDAFPPANDLLSRALQAE